MEGWGLILQSGYRSDGDTPGAFTRKSQGLGWANPPALRRGGADRWLISAGCDAVKLEDSRGCDWRAQRLRLSILSDWASGAWTCPF